MKVFFFFIMVFILVLPITFADTLIVDIDVCDSSSTRFFNATGGGLTLPLVVNRGGNDCELQFNRNSQVVTNSSLIKFPNIIGNSSWYCLMNMSFSFTGTGGRGGGFVNGSQSLTDLDTGLSHTNLVFAHGNQCLDTSSVCAKMNTVEASILPRLDSTFYLYNVSWNTTTFEMRNLPQNNLNISLTLPLGKFNTLENMVVGEPADGSDLTYNLSRFECFNNSPTISFITDTIPPFFNETSRNNSQPRINERVNVSIFAHDETELSSVSLAHNQSGTLTNITSTSASGTDDNVSFEFDITLGRGNIIGYQFTVIDTAGNTNQTGLFTLDVSNTPPQTPTILFPTADLVTMDQPLDLNVTFPSDADSDAITIFYYIDDVLNQTSLTNTTLNASTKEYVLAVSLSDGFDFSPNATVTFTIDIDNPILTITLPINNSVHSADIPVSIQCDNLNVFNFSYVFSNASQIFQTEVNDSTGITQSNIFTPIDISGLANGTYDFDVNCIDNISNSASLFFFLTIDTTVAPAPPTETEEEAFQSTFFDAIGIIALVMMFILFFVLIVTSLSKTIKEIF